MGAAEEELPLSTLPAEHPGPDHAATLGLVRQLFQEAKADKRKRLDKWGKYERLLRNQNWSETRSSWLPAPQSSEFFPVVHALTAYLTDQAPKAFVSPSPDLREFAQAPDPELIRTKTDDMQTVLGSWWILRAAAIQVQAALMDTFTFGAGIIKTGWDQTLHEGLGDAFLRRCDSWAILPDPSGSSTEDIGYLLEARRVKLNEVWARFPERAHLVRGDTDDLEVDRRPQTQGVEVVGQGNLGATGVTGLFPGTSTPGIPPLWGKRPVGRPEEYTQSCLLIECWVKDTERAEVPAITDGERIENVVIEKPVWRYIATAGGVILNEDVTNPFRHGMLPYHRIPYVENGEFWSIPLAEQLGPACVALNRLLSAMQRSAELTGNPILLEDAESGITRSTIVNRPGQRLTKNPGREVRWLDPPNMAADVMNLVGFWRDTIDRGSGLSAVARGATLRRREPASGIDAMQEASFIRVQAVRRNMEEALRVAHEQAADLIACNYIEPRAVPKVGPEGSQDYLMLGHRSFYYPEAQPSGAVEDVPLKFNVWLEAGSTVPVSRAARVAEAISLFTMGVVDSEYVLNTAEVADRKNVLERMRAAKQAGMQAPAGQNPRSVPQQ